MLHRGESARVQWADRPPPPPGFVRIIRPRPGEVLRLIALSDKIEGTDVHFWEGRTIPCRAPFNHCPACKHRKPRWEGYLMCFREVTREIVLAAVTKGAANRCTFLRNGPKLRGRRVELERIETREEGRVELRIGDFIARPQILPEAPDIRETLHRIWGIPFDAPAEGEIVCGPPQDPSPDEDADPVEIGGEGRC